MYKPDRSIVRQLKEIDADLDVVWDAEDRHWWVTCMGKPAVGVRNPDGSYRPLDGRIVAHMRKQAWEYRSFFGTFSTLDREVRQRNFDAEERKKKQRQDEFRQYAIEDIYPRAYGVGGAGGRSRFTGWSASP